ncbi:hypothetical protein U9M48_014803 [Paspalum notatum var. saurae]|uniref:Ribosomal protein S16 n=1 Tax=Paspalum notatum var. saurae TaxID=547442 RepID=A0AAQ3WKV2_PASNO
MVVECKKREITNTVKMEGYKNRTIVTNDENRLVTYESRSWEGGGGGGAGELTKEAKAMVVRLRLARFGCRNRPFYRVMAADSRSPRDGKHLEVLGYYNPLPGQDGGKRMGLKFDRLKTTFHRSG